MSEQNVLTSRTVIDGRYNLVSEGRSQDLGVAYTAYDLQDDRLVTLRVLDSRWGNGQEALNRLKRGVESIAALHAPGLIPYEYTGLVGEQLYLVHPHSQDQTLADLLAHNARLDVKAAVELAIRLCEVLAPVHRAGLVHGSLSPSCVLVKEATEADSHAATAVTVLDTGLLPALRPADASRQEPWGRLPYISPEQAVGSGIHPSSDVYVIGAILYEMLTGRPPFRAADEATIVRQHLHQEPPSLQIMDTSIPRSLAQIVYNALAKEPSSRYRNAGQLAHILRAQIEAKTEAGGQPQVEHLPPVEPALQSAQSIRQEYLVVPPPPTPAIGEPWSSTEIYDLEGDGDWGQGPKQEGVDWLMIALVVAALIAVLGLIPLWRAVYSRYATGPGSSSLAPLRLETDLAPCMLAHDLQGRQADRGSQKGRELDEWVFVWYNTIASEPSLAHLHPTDVDTRHLIECRENVLSSGVQLTGNGQKV